MPSETVMLAGILIPIAGILMGGLILLIPIAGLTLRFALKPAVEAYTRVRELQGSQDQIRLLEQRLALVEEQLRTLVLNRLVEETRPGVVPIGRIAAATAETTEAESTR